MFFPTPIEYFLPKPKKWYYREAIKNKLKSLKVAQVKDEMDNDEDDGCEGVFNVML